MFHFFQKKMLKKIRNKGTINVLQGGGGSAEYGQRPYFYNKKNLDPSLSTILCKWTLFSSYYRPRHTPNTSTAQVLYCAVLYITVQYSTVQYSTVQYCTVLYCTVLYCTVQYCTVLYSTVQYCTVLCCTVLCTVQYCTVQYCTVQYCTVLYCTVMYCTVLKPPQHGQM